MLAYIVPLATAPFWLSDEATPATRLPQHLSKRALTRIAFDLGIDPQSIVIDTVLPLQDGTKHFYLATARTQDARPVPIAAFFIRIQPSK